MTRAFPFFLCLALGVVAALPVHSQNGQGQAPSLEILKQLVPAHKATAEKLSHFKIWQIDFNGDGKKEWLLVENPNQKKKKKKVALKPNRCLCPKSKLKGKSKRIFSLLRTKKESIHNIELSKVGRRWDLKFWFSQQAAGRGQDVLMRQWCRRLGQRYRVWKKWRLRRFVSINMDNGQTARVQASRCKRLSRTRSLKKRARLFLRWRRKMSETAIKTCACPKKKKKEKIVVYKAPKQLFIVVARAKALPKAKAGQPTAPIMSPDGQVTPQLEVIGRFRGDNVQPAALTTDGKIIGLRIEQSSQLTRYSPRLTTESLYIYDEGGAERMKKVFTIETAKDNLDRQADARRWTTLTFRNMDGDDWQEIVADTFYETPEFNGQVRREMYKWFQGRYVPLNKYRGILRAQSSSTWRRIAPKGSKAIQRRLNQRTIPANVIDGFRNTSWVGGKKNRGHGDWLRVEFMRSQKLIGLAIATTPSSTPFHIIPALFPGVAPKLFMPKFIRIDTSTGLKMTVPIDPDKRYNFYRFPTQIFTRFVQITLVSQYRDSSGKTHKVVVPPKERSLGFISEILPIEDRIRYTASSFEYKGTTSFLPQLAGDRLSTTAWAEGRSDEGLGEWLQLLFPTPRNLRTLTVVNGCRRPGESYILNNRVKNLELRFSNGTTRDVVLKDSHKPQKIKLGAVRSLSVKLTIRSVYKGKLGHTTCLAEVRAD